MVLDRTAGGARQSGLPSQGRSREIASEHDVAAVAAVASFEAGVAPETGFQHIHRPADQQQRSKQHDPSSEPSHARCPEAILSRMQAT